MEKEQIAQLLNKFKAGTTTDAEHAFLEQWYAQYKGEEGMDYQLADRLEDANQIWAALPVHEERASIRKRLWPRIAVAAAAVAAIVFGVWFYTSRPIVNRNSQIVNQNDIAPGKNTATLTLANGKTINLSDTKTGVVVGDELKYNDNTIVQDSSGSHFSGSLKGDQKNTGPVRAPSLGSKNQMLTATTPRGGTYQVILPDGTKVWLNAASSLKFPSTFTNLKNRDVELTGEAYFEVTHDVAKSFRVKSKGQVIEVLGTKFNINAYDDEPAVRTALIEGSVKIVSLSLSKTETLKPGQQSLLSINNNSIKVEKADIEEAIAWKNGYFNLNNENIQDVMRKLARWYDIEVEYKGKLPDIVLGGEIPRNTKLSQALKILEVANVHFIIEGKKITVVP
jgi:transmembrane sensor